MTVDLAVHLRTMTWTEYLQTFDDILDGKTSGEPYQDEAYMEYTRLNKSRMHRWIKTITLAEETIEELNAINQKQKWMIISEPWCGDAAHILPILEKMAKVNPHIEMDIQLRDSGSEIENYLYNGTRSIPILVIRNEDGQDKAIWGPRPQACQALIQQWKTELKSKEELKLAIQQWYNEDKGRSVQQEIRALLRTMTS